MIRLFLTLSIMVYSLNVFGQNFSEEDKTNILAFENALFEALAPQPRRIYPKTSLGQTISQTKIKRNREEDKSDLKWSFSYAQGVPDYLNRITAKNAIKKVMKQVVKIITTDKLQKQETLSFKNASKKLGRTYNKLENQELEIIFSNKTKIDDFQENNIVLNSNVYSNIHDMNCAKIKGVRVFPYGNEFSLQNKIIVFVEEATQGIVEDLLVRQIIHGIGHLKHSRLGEHINYSPHASDLDTRDTELVNKSNYYHDNSIFNVIATKEEIEIFSNVSELATKSKREFVAEFYEYAVLQDYNFSADNSITNKIDYPFDLLERYAHTYKGPVPIWINFEMGRMTNWLNKTKNYLSGAEAGKVKVQGGLNVGEVVVNHLVRAWFYKGKRFINNQTGQQQTGEYIYDLDWNKYFQMEFIQSSPELSNYASAASILVAAADNVDIKTDEILKAEGYWNQFKDVLKRNTVGVFDAYNLDRVVQKIGSPKELLQLLNMKGPIIISDPNGSVARIITGMYYEPNNGEYKVYVFDPNPRGLNKLRGKKSKVNGATFNKVDYEQFFSSFRAIQNIRADELPELLVASLKEFPSPVHVQR